MLKARQMKSCKTDAERSRLMERRGDREHSTEEATKNVCVSKCAGKTQ